MGEHTEAYYREMRRSGNHKKHAPTWTEERCLHALHLWFGEEHAYPREAELCNRNGLPGHWTIRKYFGTLTGYIAAYTTYLAASPVPERDVSEGISGCGDHADGGTYEQTLVQRIQRACLRCGRQWISPHRRLRWICDRCKRCRLQNNDGDEDGSWLNGEPLKEHAHGQ